MNIEIKIVDTLKIDDDNVMMYVTVITDDGDNKHAMPIRWQYVISANSFYIDDECADYLDYMGFDATEIADAVEDR